MKDKGPPRLDHRGLAVGETHRQNHGRVDFGGAWSAADTKKSARKVL